MKRPNIFNHAFIKNLSWLTFAQLFNKVFRLAATVVIARTLMPEEYGLIAIIFTLHEIINVLISRGSQTQIVNCAQSELENVCGWANRFNWQLCLSASLLQICSAVVVSKVFQQPQLMLPIMALALGHSLLPFAMVHASINIRRGLLNLVAQIDVAQTVTETLLCLFFLYLEFGLWALILPRLIVLPIWIISHRIKAPLESIPLQYKGTASTTKLHDGLRVVTTDLLIVLKNNIDYILVGYFLGMDVLGLYYFAFNAGLGISNTLLQAAGSALFPHLCQQSCDHGLKTEFLFGSKVTVLTTSTIVVLQVSTIAWYVPLIFGERWVDFGALPIITVLCLSAIPKALLELVGQLFRAKHKFRTDLNVNALLLTCQVAAIMLVIDSGPLAVACAISSVSFGVAILVYAWVYKRDFFVSSKPKSQKLEQPSH